MAKAVPEGLHTVTAQIAVDDASAAIELYKRAFGAEEVARAMDPSGKKIWHASIRIGNSQLFVNDVFPDMGGGAQLGQFWIYGENIDGAFKRAVEAGCKASMPPTDMFWGDRMGAVVDPWGIKWNLAQHVKDLTPAEMQKAQDEFVANMKKR